MSENEQNADSVFNELSEDTIIALQKFERLSDEDRARVLQFVDELIADK